MKLITLTALLALSACSYTHTSMPTPLGQIMFGLMVPTTAPAQVLEPEEYPPGQFCTPAGDRRDGVQTPDHPCSCQRMNTSSDCDDVEKDTHDPACGQYCHEKHCACKITCAAHAEPA